MTIDDDCIDFLAFFHFTEAPFVVSIDDAACQSLQSRKYWPHMFRIRLIDNVGIEIDNRDKNVFDMGTKDGRY